MIPIFTFIISVIVLIVIIINVAIIVDYVEKATRND